MYKMYLLGIKGDNGVWLPHVPELDGFIETSGDDAFVLVGFCVGAARDWLVVRRHLLETVRAQIRVTTIELNRQRNSQAAELRAENLQSYVET